MYLDRWCGFDVAGLSLKMRPLPRASERWSPAYPRGGPCNQLINTKMPTTAAAMPISIALYQSSPSKIMGQYNVPASSASPALVWGHAENYCRLGSGSTARIAFRWTSIKSAIKPALSSSRPYSTLTSWQKPFDASSAQSRKRHPRLPLRTAVALYRMRGSGMLISW